MRDRNATELYPHQMKRGSKVRSILLNAFFLELIADIDKPYDQLAHELHSPHPCPI